MLQDTLQNVQENGTIVLTEELRRYFMSERQATIIRLGALEDLLKLERSIVPRHKRKQVAQRPEQEP